MALINYSAKEITAKIVYYGPGLSGKTTCLQWIYNNSPADRHGRLVSMATETDRTLFFDLLPLNFDTLGDFTIRLHLYTVPGQVYYKATRKMVLTGADAVIFVADSTESRKDANIESLLDMEHHLIELNNPLENLPCILHYNKRDLTDILSVEELNKTLNRREFKFFETIAIEGRGIFEGLRSLNSMLMDNLAKRYDITNKKNLKKESGGNGKGKKHKKGKAVFTIETEEKTETIETTSEKETSEYKRRKLTLPSLEETPPPKEEEIETIDILSIDEENLIITLEIEPNEITNEPSLAELETDKLFLNTITSEDTENTSPNKENESTHNIMLARSAKNKRKIVIKEIAQKVQKYKLNSDELLELATKLLTYTILLETFGKKVNLTDIYKDLIDDSENNKVDRAFFESKTIIEKYNFTNKQITEVFSSILGVVINKKIHEFFG